MISNASAIEHPSLPPSSAKQKVMWATPLMHTKTFLYYFSFSLLLLIFFFLIRNIAKTPEKRPSHCNFFGPEDFIGGPAPTTKPVCSPSAHRMCDQHVCGLISSFLFCGLIQNPWSAGGEAKAATFFTWEMRTSTVFSGDWDFHHFQLILSMCVLYWSKQAWNFQRIRNEAAQRVGAVEWSDYFSVSTLEANNLSLR